MSLVVAIKKDGVWYLGADTRISRGYAYYHARAKEMQKIVSLGAYWVAFVGNVATSQMIIDHPEWFIREGKSLTKAFLVQSVIPEIYRYLEQNQDLDREENEAPRMRCEFLLTDGKRLFVVYDDFSVCEVMDYIALGCAYSIANTYWMNGGQALEPNALILTMLRKSAELNSGVGAPFTCLNTREREYQFVEA